MQKKTENKIRMFQAVRQVLTKFIAIWQANLGFKEVADDFDNGLKAIDEIRAQTGTSTNGITNDKDVMHEDMVDSMMEISGPFGTMANRAGNQELKNSVSFTDSYLNSLPENELVQKGKDLAKLALDNKESLVKYNITEERITALDELAVKYERKIPEPRKTVSVRVSANVKLNQLIRNNSQLLKKELDGLADHYRRSNPDFWNAYFTARKVVDYGIRHEKKEEQKPAETAK